MEKFYSSEALLEMAGGGYAYPTSAIFKHVFDEHNFSIISNLFDRLTISLPP